MTGSIVEGSYVSSKTVEEATRSLETLETTKESEETHESPEGTTTVASSTATTEHVRLDQLKQVTLSVVAKDCMLGGRSETVSIRLFFPTFT